VVPPSVPLFDLVEAIQKDGARLLAVNRFRETLETVFLRSVAAVGQTDSVRGEHD